MGDRYTECPECGHHRSVHNKKKVSFTCEYAFERGPLGGRRGKACACTMTQVQIDANIALFDDRICHKCGLGKVQQKTGNGWEHRDANACIRVMGQKIKEMEREMFSRRSAIRDQKERR